MCSCSKERHQKLEHNWQEQSLALGAFHSNSLLHLKHQPEEGNVHFESSWSILEEEMRDVVLEGIRGLPEAQTLVAWKGLGDLLHQLWFDSSLWVTLAPCLTLQSCRPKGN